MTDLAGFRYELKRSCLLKPRLALADLHAQDTPNRAQWQSNRGKSGFEARSSGSAG